MTSTDPSRFDRAADLFLRARELGLPARDEFLERECAGDRALRAEVDRLLTGENRPMPLASLAEHLFDLTGRSSDADAERDDHIGPYKVLEKIGEGGFGTVYMAEQSHPVRRRVAVKVVKAGMDTKQVVARFEAERQALALMEHPNITRVLDAGSTPSGRPYFVMDLVRGVPITAYCDTHRLDTDARIELFIAVCRAVHHAHQKGVIHRDLKPSNVMVTVHDGVPVPKVIDFGIAKALHGRLTDLTLFTEFRQFIGTPEYMSPEQAEMSGLDVDTRTDLYSLGVLLYELLTGTTPLRRTLSDAMPGDYQRLIRDVEPPAPSRHVSTQAAALRRSGVGYDVPAQRATNALALHNTLKGELDWIILKCLEKDRTRRYETADALLQDLNRYLNDEPVLAGPPSTWYRLTKFARRQRLLLGTAAVVLLSLVSGLVIAWSGFMEARRQRDAAMAAMDDTKREMRTSAAIVSLMQELLAGADPDLGHGPDYTVRELLDDFSATRGDALSADPIAQGTLLATLGKAYLHLDLGEKALVQLDQALARYRSVLAADDPRIAEVLLDLGRTRDALNDGAAAAPLIEQALEIRRQRFGDASGEVADAMLALARLRLHAQQLDECEQLTRDAEQRIRATEGPTSLRLCEVDQLLAFAAQGRGMVEDAERRIRANIERLDAALGSGHPRAAAARSQLATLLVSRGRFGEAEQLLRQSLVGLRGTFGAMHPRVATSLSRLASVLDQNGKTDEAELTAREALEMVRRLSGDRDPHTAIAQANLGNLYLRHERIDEAAAQFQAAFDILDGRADGDPAALAVILNNLAMIQQRRGDLAGASALLQRAVDQRRRLGIDNDPTLVEMMYNVALMQREGGDAEAAEATLTETLSRTRAHVGSGTPTEARVLVALGLIAADRGDAARARDLAGQAIAILDAHPAAGNPTLGDALSTAGLAELGLQHPADAESLLRRCLELRRKLFPADNVRILWAQLDLGDTLRAQHRLDEADEQILPAAEKLWSLKAVTPKQRQRVLDQVKRLFEDRPDRWTTWAADHPLQDPQSDHE